MSVSNQPLSAIDRARIAYERMVERKRAAAMARHLRERSRRIRILIFCGALIAMLVGTAIYNNWLTSPSPRLRDVATADFGKTRTGQVRSFVKGDTCQELQFSNISGDFVGGNLVPCDVVVRKEIPPSNSGSRAFSIRDAFNR